MADQEPPPRIVARRHHRMSPWFTVVEKDVAFPWASELEVYHAVVPLPYVAVVAVTDEDTVALIRQWRPAIETYTWELPAGLVDTDESPEGTCRRELLEETGLTATSLQSLGAHAVDTGRVQAFQETFLARCTGPEPEFVAEPGTEVTYVDVEDIPEWVASGRITSLLHVGALYLAHLRHWSAASVGDAPLD